MSMRADQRGAALILVLWMVVGLSLVVLAGAQSARLYTQRVGLEFERIRVDAALEGATELVLSKLMAHKRAKVAHNIRTRWIHKRAAKMKMRV